MRRGADTVARLALLGGVVAIGGASPALPMQPAAAICAAVDRPPRELAVLVESLGAPARAALVEMASRGGDDARCGLAGLAAVRDESAAAQLGRAIDAAPEDPDVWRLVRLAAFVAGGPAPGSGAPLAALLPRLDTAAARAAAGDDRLRLLGELDHPDARAQLVRALDEPMSAGAIDAAIHGLARQREPRARARVAALGLDVAAGLAGNATYEQARRLGAVAFYLLVLTPETHADGLALLAKLSPSDQADTIAWAAQTLCEFSVRHPESRSTAIDLRDRVVAAAAGLEWRNLVRGTFPCAPS